MNFLADSHKAGTMNDYRSTAPRSLPFGELPPDDIIFGISSSGESIRLIADMAASTHVPVLIQGQSGTGKEIVARYIHNRSSWGNGEFVKVNCPAVPGALLESEFFGYQKGAFTGAYCSKPGRVELADRGTLFLDEIAELELGLQAKLLQLLQDGQFSRIGEHEERRIDVRVVCATNRQLEKEIKSGTFRHDLYYRINVLTIELLPLRERRYDIPVLVNFLLDKHGRKLNRPVRPLSSAALTSLEKYDWPGNVRELETIIKRYVLSGNEAIIDQSLQKDEDQDLDPIPLGRPVSLKAATRQAVKRLEKKIILQALEAHRWNRRETARALQLSYAALLYKMREAGVPPRMAGQTKKGRSKSCLDLATKRQAVLHQHQSDRPI